MCSSYRALFLGTHMPVTSQPHRLSALLSCLASAVLDTAGAQAEGAVAGSSCEVPAQGPSQPQTVVPVEPADAAAQDNADAGQVTAQAVSAAMPPPGPAAQNRDVTIKDWEWLAMLLSSLPAAMS